MYLRNRLPSCLFLYFLTSVDGSVTHWIGATDVHAEALWIWVDGTPVAMGTPFWAPTEPNNWHGTEDCLSILSNTYSAGYFNDYTCSLEFFFICEDLSQ